MKQDFNVSDVIQSWKDLNIGRCEMEFSCGGDSMNDYTFIFYDNKNEKVETELESYFEDNVFYNVEFYEVSDGHYLGESGVVHIALNDEEDGFDYSKSAYSEWSENHTETTLVLLTPEEIEFVNGKVLNLVGNQDGIAINYKVDCILNDQEVELSENLLNKLSSHAEDYVFEDVDGEEEEWWSFETNEIVGDKIQLQVSRNFLTTTESEI
jgi:hypothetical protein